MCFEISKKDITDLEQMEKVFDTYEFQLTSTELRGHTIERTGSLYKDCIGYQPIVPRRMILHMQDNTDGV